ncbi:MAG: alkaline phosphatase [Eubacteriales bacterium]
MFKRFTAFLLAVLTVFALVGCTGNGAVTDSTSTPDTEGIVPVELTADILKDYVVRRPENVKNESIDVTIQAAKKLRDTINETFELNLELIDDWYKKVDGLPETAKEFLVGKTNRVETANALAVIRSKDYVIAFENDRIVITGGTDVAVGEAVDYFIETYIDKAAKKITLTEHMLDIVEYDYPMGMIKVNGTDIKNYKVVYPKNCDLVTYYTAVVISDYIYSNAGVKLEVADDTVEASEYEILVGDTNRPESNIGIKLTDEQYSLSANGKKIVLQGNYQMAGAAASVLINDYFANDGKPVDVTDLPTAPTASEFTFKEAKSGIMLIGDGMSNIHFSAAIDTGVIPEFVAERLPNRAMCTTASYSVLNQGASYTDSAASATALAGGYKTINKYVGLDHTKAERQNIRELAHAFGAKTAVVTTDKITGATPAGYLCHHTSRDDSAVLQSQIDKLVADGLVDYVYGANKNNTADLTFYAREALSVISEGDNSFFIMIEEAYIDKNSHNNDLTKTTKSVKIYNDVIAYCIAYTMVRGDVLLVITADHDCGNLEKKANGSYVYNATTHTNKNVPVFALGDGAAELLSKDVIDNTDIPKAFAKLFGSNNFGS